jgi:hypothetical protein
LKRKLIFLNLALVALIGAACWQLRVQWIAAHQHEKEVLGGGKLKPAAALGYVPPSVPPPVVAAQYLDVATKDLFSKDRNPNVIVDPQPPPPPPPPMPALPIVKGLMNFGGVTAIMSEAGKAGQKEYKPGDQIGQFKLVAINSQEIVLEWNGQEVRRNVEELFDRSIPEPAAAASGPSAPTAPAPSKPNIKVPAAPGVDIGAGKRACVAGDDSPPGTVVDGMKKISWDTPFAKGCAWEPAK